MGYIGAHGVAALHKHKYSGVDHSYVAKYILQPFWTRCVAFFPLWMPIGTVLGLPVSDIMYLMAVTWSFQASATVFHFIFSLKILLGAIYVGLFTWIDSTCPWWILYIITVFAFVLMTQYGIHLFRITLIGSMFLVTSASLGFIYSPHLDSPPPRWVHLAHGILLFLYQTFDAVDGKQARRTNSSSPLGELFDHGCDALACTFEALAFGSTAMCGKDTFWFWVISAVPFYGATWEHFFTNTLILPVVNGPTEGLMLIYVGHIFTAIVGAEWWVHQFGKSLPFLSWVPILSEVPTYRAVLYLMVAFAVIPTLTFNVQNVYKVVQARKGSMLLALAMLYPFVVLMAGILIWDYLSPYDIMVNYPYMVVLGTGLAFGFLVGRMVLAHLCDEPKGLKTNMCMSLVYLPFAIANTLTAKLNDGIPLVEEKWVLLGYCVYTGALYLHFATSVIHEITTALGIYCFRITRKEA